MPPRMRSALPLHSRLLNSSLGASWPLKMELLNALALLLLAATFGLAHPHDADEKVHHHSAQPLYRRTLSHCQSAFKEPEFVKRTINRRQDEVARLQKSRGIESA
jgi:hypothetical protein